MPSLTRRQLFLGTAACATVAALPLGYSAAAPGAGTIDGLNLVIYGADPFDRCSGFSVDYGPTDGLASLTERDDELVLIGDTTTEYRWTEFERHA